MISFNRIIVSYQYSEKLDQNAKLLSVILRVLRNLYRARSVAVNNFHSMIFITSYDGRTIRSS